MGKKLTWLEITILLIPLSFILYQIFNYSFGENKAGGLVFVLVLMSFTNFFYARHYDNYFVLTIVAYSVVAILGAAIMALLNQEWMIIFLIFALYFVKAFTSRTTDYGAEIDKKIEEEETQRTGLGKLISTPTQRAVNTQNLKDTALFIVVAVVAFFAYDYFSNNYEQMVEYNKIIEERSK